jgi:hypothetical protein
MVVDVGREGARVSIGGMLAPSLQITVAPKSNVGNHFLCVAHICLSFNKSLTGGSFNWYDTPVLDQRHYPRPPRAPPLYGWILDLQP